MMNHGTEKDHKCGPECKAVSFETPFGAVVYFPESSAGLTFLVVAGQEPRRVRGAEKRLLITFLTALKDLRARPLPALSMN
jgi:hypothetical protein